jgi:hypothetical protein
VLHGRLPSDVAGEAAAALTALEAQQAGSDQWLNDKLNMYTFGKTIGNNILP